MSCATFRSKQRGGYLSEKREFGDSSSSSTQGNSGCFTYQGEGAREGRSRRSRGETSSTKLSKGCREICSTSQYQGSDGGYIRGSYKEL